MSAHLASIEYEKRFRRPDRGNSPRAFPAAGKGGRLAGLARTKGQRDILEAGLLDIWPTNGPRIKWSKKIGTGYGAPSIRNANLVVHHRIGNEEIVESFKQSSGESLWRYGYPSAFVDPYGYNDGPRASPLLTSNRVYTFGAEGKLLCLDRNTGNVVWQRDTAKEWDIPPAFFPASAVRRYWKVSD